MPSKPRHGKGNHATQTKKGPGRQRRPAVVGPPPAAAQTGGPVSQPGEAAPAVSVPAPTLKPASVQHPHIVTELRTIAILAGVVLAILAVLALVLA